MPRFARLQAPGSVYHLMARFTHHCYRMTDEARAQYLCALAHRDPLCRLILPLHAGFAAWLNRAQGALGPVFSDRFRSVVCDRERTGVLLAYVHNNPVRATVVAQPEHSDWTSHRAYAGLAPAPPGSPWSRGWNWRAFRARRALMASWPRMMPCLSCKWRLFDLKKPRRP